jgi:hypothetical protein
LKGKLDTFSLPELFRSIDAGTKTGKLTIEKAIEGNSCEIWFEAGQMLTISIPAKRQDILNALEERGWLGKATIAQVGRFYRNNQPLGFYLERMGLFSKEQQQSIFTSHLQQIELLFKLQNNAFELQEIPNLSAVEVKIDIPWSEMSGERIKATEISFKALHKLDNWEHLIEQLPNGSYALQRLVKQPTVELLPMDIEVWNYADSRTPLKTIAQKIDRPLLEVQKTAFAMIMANFLEETIPSKFSSPALRETTATQRTSATATKTAVASSIETKSEVNTSLLQNLVSFLKGKF